MASPKKKAKIIGINCPVCNVVRTPRLVTIENSRKILCKSPSCTREIYSEKDTLIPEQIKDSPRYLNEYIRNFNSIGSGLVVLGSIQSTFNVRLTQLGLGVSDIVSCLTTIHRNQVYSYKVAVSYGRPFQDRVR